MVPMIVGMWEFGITMLVIVVETIIIARRRNL